MTPRQMTPRQLERRASLYKRTAYKLFNDIEYGSMPIDVNALVDQAWNTLNEAATRLEQQARIEREMGNG